MKIRPANSAFSLVELSIALAVIGLLAGGIIVGNSLIQRAKIGQVSSGLTKYATAFMQFQQQFHALPGDFTDATEQWGTDSVTGGCASPTPVAADRVPKEATCNGNGSNAVDWPETFRLWQHLSNAKLVDGKFTGVSGSSGAGTHAGAPGENSPTGPFENSGFFITSSPTMVGQANYYDQLAGNQVNFGTAVTNDWTWGPVLTPKEQYGLDQKIDDGKPSTGALRSLKSPRNPNCTTSDVDASADYSLSQSGRNCTVFWNLQPT